MLAMDGCQHLGSELAQVLAAKIGQAWLQLDSAGVAGRYELVHSVLVHDECAVATTARAQVLPLMRRSRCSRRRLVAARVNARHRAASRRRLHSEAS